MRSIKELSAEANAYPFSPGVSFLSWVHVCQTLQREALIYDSENDPHGWERAFVLNLRLADLVLNRLPRHPALSEYRKQYSRVCSQIPGAIQRSEALKKRLEARQPQPSPQPAAVPAPKVHPSLDQDKSLESAEQADDFETAQIQLDDSVRATLQSLKNPRQATSRSQSYTPMLPEYPALSSMAQPLTKPIQHQATPPVQSPRPPQAPQMQAQAPKQQSSDAQHRSVYTTEKGEKLRPLYVPADLRARFLELAVRNTRANLETCGILCGKLNRNAFFITDLVVPHQTSTSDSCDMTNEEELFEYADKKDLFILGWIHTHPSQSCFMSSIDLHTQAGYQIMLPEAIAIVCAPRSDPSWGVFRLTDPPGIDTIKRCRLSGFHPHEQPDLYRLAIPGHVKEISYAFAYKDMRG